MPENAEHGAASSQPKLDTSQSLSSPLNAPPSGPPGSPFHAVGMDDSYSDKAVTVGRQSRHRPFMPWGWMTAIPTKPSPLDLTMDRGESFKLYQPQYILSSYCLFFFHLFLSLPLSLDLKGDVVLTIEPVRYATYV